jgi:hypothetical protein
VLGCMLAAVPAAALVNISPALILLVILPLILFWEGYQTSVTWARLAGDLPGRRAGQRRVSARERSWLTAGHRRAWHVYGTRRGAWSVYSIVVDSRATDSRINSLMTSTLSRSRFNTDICDYQGTVQSLGVLRIDSLDSLRRSGINAVIDHFRT